MEAAGRGMNQKVTQSTDADDEQVVTQDCDLHRRRVIEDISFVQGKVDQRAEPARCDTEREIVRCSEDQAEAD